MDDTRKDNNTVSQLEKLKMLLQIDNNLKKQFNEQELKNSKKQTEVFQKTDVVSLERKGLDLLSENKRERLLSNMRIQNEKLASFVPYPSKKGSTMMSTKFKPSTAVDSNVSMRKTTANMRGGLFSHRVHGVNPYRLSLGDFSSQVKELDGGLSTQNDAGSSINEQQSHGFNAQDGSTIPARFFPLSCRTSCFSGGGAGSMTNRINLRRKMQETESLLGVKEKPKESAAASVNFAATMRPKKLNLNDSSFFEKMQQKMDRNLEEQDFRSKENKDISQLLVIDHLLKAKTQ